jgi:protein TonB
MNFAQQQAAPGRRIVGLGVVFLFHALVVYALITGLAKRVVDVIRAPIETKVIEEIKKPPPPPEVVLPPPPKLEAPPPPFIPPPEIQIANPPPAPTITATIVAPPPAPMVVTAPPAPVAAPVAPATAPSVGVVCPGFTAIVQGFGFPKEASRQSIERGEALIQFTVTASGEVKDVHSVRASNPIFARNGIRAVGDFKCQGQGHDIVVQVPLVYKLE